MHVLGIKSTLYDDTLSLLSPSPSLDDQPLSTRVCIGSCGCAYSLVPYSPAEQAEYYSSHRCVMHVWHIRQDLWYLSARFLNRLVGVIRVHVGRIAISLRKL
jgi:hypothetical protein